MSMSVRDVLIGTLLLLLALSPVLAIGDTCGNGVGWSEPGYGYGRGGGCAPNYNPAYDDCCNWDQTAHIHDLAPVLISVQDARIAVEVGRAPFGDGTVGPGIDAGGAVWQTVIGHLIAVTYKGVVADLPPDGNGGTRVIEDVEGHPGDPGHLMGERPGGEGGGVVRDEALTELHGAGGSDAVLELQPFVQLSQDNEIYLKLHLQYL